MASMDTQPELLDATAEAALSGRSKSQISRARRKLDHPVNGPHGVHVMVGSKTHHKAPRDLIAAWWGPPRPPGRKRIHQPAPPGWTIRQWRGLLTIARGEQVSPAMIRLLQDRGALGQDGQLTDEGRRLTASTATTHEGDE